MNKTRVIEVFVSVLLLTFVTLAFWIGQIKTLHDPTVIGTITASAILFCPSETRQKTNNKVRATKGSVYITTFLIALLIMVLFVGVWQIKPVGATTFLDDDFELGNGFSAWTGTVGTPTIDTDPVHHGVNSTLINADECVNYTLASPTDDAIYVRSYVYFTTLPAAANYMLSVCAFQYSGYADNYAYMAQVYNDAGTVKFRIYNGASGSGSYCTTLPSTGQWYSIELKADRNANGEMWINDASEAILATSNYAISGMYVGSRRSHSGVENIDCVVVADAYIGVESGVSGVSFSDFGTTTTVAGASCKFYVNCTALSGTLNYSIFSTNNTGSWVNDTAIAFSGATWANTTKTLNYTNYVYVQWKLYANTSEGDWSETGMKQLITTPSNVAYAASGSSTDIQTAVSAMNALGGGTVYVPAGNFTFVIPAGRISYGGKHAGVIINTGVSIFGAGDNQTILYCNSYFNDSNNVMFAVQASNDLQTRISGILFQADVHGHLDTYPQQIAGIIEWGAKDMRIDHCTFLDMTDAAIGTSNNYVHDANGNCGVIDHCIIDNPYKDWYYSVVGIQPYWAYGIVITHDANQPDGYPNWNPNYADFFGQYGHAIWYIEDCSIARTRHCVSGGSQSNAFYVLRYSNMTDMRVASYGSYQDVHGGGLGAECYNNTVINVGTSGVGFCSRGGFALYYNNTIQDIPLYGSGIRLTNDQSAYYDYRTHDAWIWGNTFENVATPFDAIPNAYPLVENTDYWLRAPTQELDGWTYTPYAYPHPLTVGPTPPSYSNVGFNTTLANAECKFSAKIYDNDGNVSGYIFSTNNTGTYQNETWTTLSETVDWGNITKTLNSTVGTVVSFRWYFNDSDNLWGDTGTWSLTTTSGGTNTLNLINPDDAENQTSNLATFTYIPFFADTIENASLWLNISATWQFAAWNTTTILNDTSNEFTFNFGAYTSATYAWNIRVYNTTNGVFAPTNRTMNVQINPICESISHSETTLSVPCDFQAVFSDEDGLSGFIFGTNNTAVWINQTWTAFVYGNGNWTLTLNETIGNVVQYRFWGNDTDNHWTTSSLGTLTITEVGTSYSTYTVSQSENIYVTAGNSQSKIVMSSTEDLYCVFFKLLAGRYQIYLGYSVNDGVTWSETRISNLTGMDGYDQVFPSIMMDSDDYLHAVWQGSAPTYPYAQIWYANYTTSWSTPERLSTYSGMDGATQNAPAITVDSTDYLHVVWYGGATSYTKAQMWYVNYTVTGWSAPLRISTVAGMDDATLKYPCIVVGASNYLHVIFRGNATGYSYSQIWYTKYTTSWSAPIVISTYAGMNVLDQISPALAIDSNDFLYAGWHGKATGFTSNQIWIAKYNGAWQTPERISTYAGMDGYSQEDPTIAVDLNNFVHVMWMGKATGYTDYNKIWYSNYVSTWNAPICLQITGQNQYPNILWSKYPSFNRPTTRLDYIFTSGTASPYNVTYGFVSIISGTQWGGWWGRWWGYP